MINIFCFLHIHTYLHRYFIHIHAPICNKLEHAGNICRNAMVHVPVLVAGFKMVHLCACVGVFAESLWFQLMQCQTVLGFFIQILRLLPTVTSHKAHILW